MTTSTEGQAMELEPSSTAFVVVHLQHEVVDAEGAFASLLFPEQVALRNILGVTADLLGAFRAAGAPVIYTRIAWRPDYSDLKINSPLLGMVAQMGCLKEGSPMAEIVPAVAPHGEDTVVTHQRVGAFAGSHLEEALQERGITTLVIAGVATNVSVEGTARWAGDLGYRVVVVEDACAAASLEAHQASIESMSVLAEISTAAEVAHALTSSQAT